MKAYCLKIIILCSGLSVHAQDSLPGKDYLAHVQHRSQQLAQQLDKRTNKAYEQLLRQEKKMQARLALINPAAAASIFITKKKQLLPAGVSNGYLDTLKNTLSFLHQPSQEVQQLEDKLQAAEQLKNYIRERKELLSAQLAGYTGFTKDLQTLSRQAYYYNEQLKDYKATLSDPSKITAKAMALLQKLPAYNDFLAKHSQLAGLFNLTANYNNTGLQTRTQVEQLLGQRTGSGPVAQQAVSQQMEQARAKFSELKAKFPQLDNAAEMPGFQPNEMKHKKLLQRLEFGGNIQFQRNSRYFPTTGDIAAQIAYKFHKKGSAGLGLSYKLGMGEGWNKISFSHQGIGFRSFADWKLKGSFYFNGGYELNRFTAFTNIEALQHWNGYQQSGLIGLSRKSPIGPKLKTNVMVLFDFLAARQLPPSDVFKFRVGYTF